MGATVGKPLLYTTRIQLSEERLQQHGFCVSMCTTLLNQEAQKMGIKSISMSHHYGSKKGMWAHSQFTFSSNRIFLNLFHSRGKEKNHLFLTKEKKDSTKKYPEGKSRSGNLFWEFSLLFWQCPRNANTMLFLPYDMSVLPQSSLFTSDTCFKVQLI